MSVHIFDSLSIFYEETLDNTVNLFFWFIKYLGCKIFKLYLYLKYQSLIYRRILWLFWFPNQWHVCRVCVYVCVCVCVYIYIYMNIYVLYVYIHIHIYNIHIIYSLFIYIIHTPCNFRVHCLSLYPSSQAHSLPSRVLYSRRHLVDSLTISQPTPPSAPLKFLKH